MKHVLELQQSDKPSGNTHQAVTMVDVETAYESVSKKRKGAWHNSDIWHTRFHWGRIKGMILRKLGDGEHRPEPAQLIQIKGNSIRYFHSVDAIIMTAIKTRVSGLIERQVRKCCVHLAKRGGQKGAIRKLVAEAEKYPYVLKSDVYSYYESIDQNILLTQLKSIGLTHKIVALMSRYIQHLVCDHAELRPITKGISKGSPLSPLYGALYLRELDEAMMGYAKRHGGIYVRYMDDWICLVKTKAQLRKMVRTMHTILGRLKLRAHPDKTYIGKLSKGVDFLGYRITNKLIEPIRIATETLKRHQAKVCELYEQHKDKTIVRAYVKRWHQWAKAGLSNIAMIIPPIDDRNIAIRV